MLKFLGQQAIFKAVPRPALRYCNRMAPRWVHSSRGGEDVSGAGTNGSVGFWLGRIDQETGFAASIREGETGSSRLIREGEAGAQGGETGAQGGETGALKGFSGSRREEVKGDTGFGEKNWGT
jgi:hypothetical protein